MSPGWLERGRKDSPVMLSAAKHQQGDASLRSAGNLSTTLSHQGAAPRVRLARGSTIPVDHYLSYCQMGLRYQQFYLPSFRFAANGDKHRRERYFLFCLLISFQQWQAICARRVFAASGHVIPLG